MHSLTCRLRYTCVSQTAGADDDEDVPDLVDNFEEAASVK